MLKPRIMPSTTPDSLSAFPQNRLTCSDLAHSHAAMSDVQQHSRFDHPNRTPRSDNSVLCRAAWMSRRLFVAGYLGYVRLSGFPGGIHPAGVAVICDADADERAEGLRVDAFVAVTHDCPVDVIGDDQG